MAADPPGRVRPAEPEPPAGGTDADVGRARELAGVADPDTAGMPIADQPVDGDASDGDGEWGDDEWDDAWRDDGDVEDGDGHDAGPVGDRDESTWSMVRRFRRELPARPTLDEAVTSFAAELPFVVRARSTDPDDAGPPLARRTALETERVGRAVRFVATYQSALAAKVVTVELTFPGRRLIRHARQGFADVHGFVLDELFEIDEILLDTVDWWAPGDEHHTWP